MNERILDLAEQAGIAVWGDAVYMYNPKDTLDSAALEKFAQLIVRECIGIADEYDGVGSTIVGRIEKHFGVEE